MGPKSTAPNAAVASATSQILSGFAMKRWRDVPLESTAVTLLTDQTVVVLLHTRFDLPLPPEHA